MVAHEERVVRGRRAFSLVEIVAVLAIVAIFVAVGAARLGPDPLRNYSTESDARRLALDLLQTQRRAISTGDNHHLEFSPSGGNYTGYTIYRRLSGGGTQAVEGYRDFRQAETVSATNGQLEFTFDGSALAAYQVTFTGPNQTWRVSVVPVTGAVRVVRL